MKNTSSSSRLRLFVISLLLLAHATDSYADDSSAGVTLGGMLSEPQGSVTPISSSLSLLRNNVAISLDIKVSGNARAQLILRTPRFGWLGESETYPERQFPELQVTSPKGPLLVDDSFVAFMGSTDVTEAIRNAHLDPFAITETPPFVNSKTADIAAINRLIQLGAIEKSESNYLAKWKIQRVVKISVKSGLDTIDLEYKVRPAFVLCRLRELDKPAFLEKYCLSARDLMAMSSGFGRSQMFVATEYSIPVSVDNKPIASVMVHTDATRTAFCGTGRKSVIGRTDGPTDAAASTDSTGTVHVLAIATAHQPTQ